MTRGFKVTFLTAAALGLGLGGYWGHSEASEVSASLVSGQYIAPTKVASDFARAQFMHADTDHARQAVMFQIHLLEQLEKADSSFRADELGWAYTRLAMIEEAAGHPEAEKSTLAQARASYSRRHPGAAELTDDEMKNGVRRVDQALNRE